MIKFRAAVAATVLALLGALLIAPPPAQAVATTVYNHESSKYGLNIFSNSTCKGTPKHIGPGGKAGPPDPPTKLYWISFWHYPGTNVTVYAGTASRNYRVPSNGEKLCRIVYSTPHSKETYRIT